MRNEAVAGSFYPVEKSALESFINSAIKSSKIDESAVKNAYAYISPHAGYMYSGSTAAYTYRALSKNENLEDIDTVVVVGPNHTGYGEALSVSADNWRTPIGIAINDLEFSNALASESKAFSIDEEAHRAEHSIEVQIPFLQTVFRERKDVKYVFICMGDQSPEASLLVSKSLLKTMEKLGRKITVIASSDFDHYESAKVAEGKDRKLIEALLKFDYREFYKQVYTLKDSACGFGPMATALLYAKGMGAAKGELLKYSNSGDVTGDYSSVVAYASLAFV
ncbi:MAG: MEMO1 family protein [Candidatus Micrarchaeaceae archaeon]